MTKLKSPAREIKHLKHLRYLEPVIQSYSSLSLGSTGLKNDCASQCPAGTIVGSGAGSFKMEASSREKKQPEFKMKK